MPGVAKATTTTSASANGSTLAVRDTARGSKNRTTIIGSIAALFQAAKAIMRGKDDEPEPKKRREKEGERDGGMMRFALRFNRHFGAKAAQRASVMKAARKGFKTAQAAIVASNGNGFGADLASLDPAALSNPLGFFEGDEAYQCEEDFDAQADCRYDAA